MSDKHIVKAHEQAESMKYAESFGEHVDRAHASQAEFDYAKKFLTKLYGGKRCVVCELRGENPYDHHPENHIESHHVIEWSHEPDIDDMRRVEVILRALSPFIHGLYMMSVDDILAGKPIPSLWDHPELKDKPFTSLDDPRCQWFLCHAHHQQSTKHEIADGFDVIGLHHLPLPQWILYMVLPHGKYPVHHVDIHDDGLDRKV